MFRLLLKINRNNALFSVNRGPRIFYLLKPCRHYKHVSLDPNQVELYVKLLDIDSTTAEKFLKKDKRLRVLSNDHLVTCLSLCKKYGLQREDILEYPRILKYAPNALEHRVLFLAEAGTPQVTAKMITSFHPIMKKSVASFKEYCNVPPEHDVGQSLLGQLHQPPPEVPPMQQMNDDISMYELHIHCLGHYIQWKLELAENELNVLPKYCKRLRYRSFKILKQTMDLLENEIGFSKKKLRTNIYLLRSHPDNVRRLLNEINIAGLDVQATLLKHPKFVVSNIDMMHRKLQNLKDLGITEMAIQKCPAILTLSTDTVSERFNIIGNVPEFIPLRNHPRLLELVMYIKKAQKRLQNTRDLKIKCPSLHLLVAPKRVFDRYERNEGDRSRGKDVVGFLSGELAGDYTFIRSELMKHPFWRQTALLLMKSTLDFLIKKYRREDIVKNIQILLYPRRKVEKTLQSIGKMDLVEFQHPITHSQQLALCIYLMERDHHFTGNGIWSMTQRKQHERTVTVQSVEARVQGIPEESIKMEVPATL